MSRQLRASTPIPSSTAQPRSSLARPTRLKWPAVSLSSQLTAYGFPYLVAVIDGTVVGYAYAGPYRARPAYRFTVENSVYVAHDSHRRGVGKALLQALIEACTEKGFRLMVAVIGDSKQAASIGLHEAAGFKHAGVFENIGYKFDRWLDSVLMQRALGPGASKPP